MQLVLALELRVNAAQVAATVRGEKSARIVRLLPVAKKRAEHARDGSALSSMAKVVTTELLQDLAQSATELLGTDGLRWSPRFGDDAGAGT